MACGELAEFTWGRFVDVMLGRFLPSNSQANSPNGSSQMISFGSIFDIKSFYLPHRMFSPIHHVNAHTMNNVILKFKYDYSYRCRPRTEKSRD